jgi:hypothetical protein
MLKSQTWPLKRISHSIALFYHSNNSTLYHFTSHVNVMNLPLVCSRFIEANNRKKKKRTASEQLMI